MTAVRSERIMMFLLLKSLKHTQTGRLNFHSPAFLQALKCSINTLLLVRKAPDITL